MSIPGSLTPLFNSGAAAGGYQIERSLRFNSADSAYLSRTPAVAGNRRTWTWAGWVKRSALGVEQYIFSCMANDVSFYTNLLFEVNDKIYIYDSLTANGRALVTTQLFRDPSAWFHILLHYNTTDATNSNKAKLYINGTEVTQFDEDNRSYLTSDASVNRTAEHDIGKRNYSPAPQYLSGYLADIHFIDGQALTPSSFTEVSATTGQLIPLAYSGTFGTNGFWLKFSDNSAATAAALGNDYSGNNNDWTPNNLSVTAGAGNDSLVDSPTSYGTDTSVGNEVRGNYCTWNPLDNAGLVLLNGNLQTNNTVSAYYSCRGTIKLPSTGKWYFETTVGNPVGAAVRLGVGTAGGSTEYFVSVDATQLATIGPGGSRTYSTSITGADSLLAVAYDADTQKLWFGFNNSWLDGSTGLTGNPAAGTNPTYTSISDVFPTASQYSASNVNANFGQRAFAYTAPSGFKALCDTNLPAPLTAKPNTLMDVVTYTGTGSNLTLPNGSSTPTSIAFTPDFVWLKGRSGATDHALYDAVRGVQKEVSSNNTSAETTETTGLTAFGTNTFTVGSLARLNTSSATYVAWAWNAGGSTVTNTAGSITSQVRANPTAGVSIVSYTGIGAGTPIDTIGHGLGVSPVMVLAKNRDIDNFLVTRSDFPNPLRGVMYLNSTAGVVNVTVDAFSFSSTTVGLRQSSMCSAAGQRIILYVFAPVVGYSSFGSYVGNGSADGPFVYTGMRPRWVMVKCSSASGFRWIVWDSARDPYNLTTTSLAPNLSDSEITGFDVDIVSNGFKLRDSENTLNQSGVTYIYAAFAENPFQYSRAR